MDNEKDKGNGLEENPVARAMIFYWGEKCKDYEPTCPICIAWHAYDIMKGKSNDQISR